MTMKGLFLCLLLLRHTHSATTTAGGLGVLAPHTQAPVVTQATVSSDLLHALQIFTELSLQVVRHHLTVLAILNVLLSVEEPVWDLVLAGVAHDSHDLLNLLFSQLPSTLGLVNVCLLQHNVGVAPTNTLDGRHGEHNLAPAINVGVHQTQDVLELLRQDERHRLGEPCHH